MTQDEISSNARPKIQEVVVATLGWMTFTSVLFVIFVVWGVQGVLGLTAVLSFFWLVGRSYDRFVVAEV